MTKPTNDNPKANPTSNHIYETIGYEAVRDVDAYRFERT